MVSIPRLSECFAEAGLDAGPRPWLLPDTDWRRIVFECAPWGREVDALRLVATGSLGEGAVNSAFAIGGFRAVRDLISGMLEDAP